MTQQNASGRLKEPHEQGGGAVLQVGNSPDEGAVHDERNHGAGTGRPGKYHPHRNSSGLGTLLICLHIATLQHLAEVERSIRKVGQISLRGENLPEAAGLERIFETGPVFRAEKSYTNKHATEFTGFDLEFSYIDSFEDVMKMEEELLTYALTKVKEAHGDAIKELYGMDLDKIEYAAEIALEHHLGLTCDPIFGLVQIPCIERNAYAAARALDANLYSMYTDGHHRVSFDRVVEVMKQTGHDLPSIYKETGEGGLAKDFF